MARRRGHWRPPVQAGGCVLLLMMAVLAAGSPPAVARAVEPVAASSVDPCSLLTSSQLHQLAVNAGVKQGAACVWTTISRAPWRGEYLGQLLHGPAPGGSPAAAIYNRPTVEHTPANLNPRAYCVYLIDLGGGVTLWAQYGAPDQAGITHTVACKNAQAGAADMISTYSVVTH
jgi:hypothetical protein